MHSVSRPVLRLRRATRLLAAAIPAALVVLGCASLDVRHWFASDEPPAATGNITLPVETPPPAKAVYVVQPGDTLWKIARRHGVSAEALVRENGLANPDHLRKGQSLLLPAGIQPIAPPRVTRAARPRPATTPAVSAPPPAEAAPGAADELASAARLPGQTEATLGGVDCMLRDADQSLRDARFEETLADTGKARTLLTPLGSDPGTSDRRAHLEVVAATAEVALGREDEARASFERALAADPGLALQPEHMSPKVLRLFDETRAKLEASREGAPATADSATYPESASTSMP
ncbi:MAG TPA: LysM domain-containing protein [Myxococcota bacterium]|nr:LysM domain-containing protein [Myxococcota bacterium]